MAAVKINAKMWGDRLNRKIAELSRLTGKSMSKIVASSMDHFLRAAGKNTPQAKRKKRPLEQSTNGRDWALFAKQNAGLKNMEIPEAKGETLTSRKGKIYFFRYKKFAKKYEKIKYRGVGKMGWWVNLMRLTFNSSKPRGYDEQMERAALKYSRLSKGAGLISRTPFITARNRIQSIARYGNIAYKMALRSTAKWVNAQARNLKQEIKQQFNRAA